ncbi:hypothetical protein EZH22_23280 [Xanthobacter dioxanivorans]|uniref:Uncharacterized protein n=1 Tax=Xanthobacter dioxanivorans TaxID=2528964 RepID=A0A974PLP7_9HYPH|nr:hypothetical protein [Xanthobacter dioxanivorans]QRG05912.1 hypothetical protein EZH22_23280 [Xanthobacter dioxanivorans]
MVSEEDVWRTAFIIAEQYGPEGVAFAARMAESFEIGGKMDEHRAWVAIMTRVESLTTEHDAAVRPS